MGKEQQSNHREDDSRDKGETQTDGLSARQPCGFLRKSEFGDVFVFLVWWSGTLHCMLCPHGVFGFRL